VAKVVDAVVLTGTRWPSKERTGEGKPFKLKWATMARRLAKPDPPPQDDKNNLPLWTLGRFRKHYRNTDSHIASCGLVLDYDANPDLDAKALLAAWGDVCFLAHTSWSHDPASMPKWRVLIPLNREVDADEYKTLMSAAARRLDGLDQRPAAQGYFIPAHRDGYEHVCYDEGAPWPVDDILEGERARQQQEEQDRPQYDRAPPTTDDRMRRYALAALDSECQQLGAMGKGTGEAGGRHQRILLAAKTMGALEVSCGVSRSVAEGAIMAAAEQCGAIKDYGFKSVTRTVADGYRMGLEAPREPEPRHSRWKTQRPPPPDDDDYSDNGDNGGGAPDWAETPHPAESPDDDAPRSEDAIPEDRSVLAHFHDAPIPDDAEIPYPYSIDQHGRLVKTIQTGQGDRVEEKDIPVCDGPLFITDLDHDVNDGCTYASLVFRGDGGTWGDAMVKKGIIANANKVSELANYGAPVLSTQGKMLIKWLRAYERTNFSAIRHRRLSGRLGWHVTGDRLTGFLFADRWLGDKGTEIHHQSEHGITQLAQAVRAVGDPIEELRALQIAMEFPPVAIVIGASLAAPLLRIFGCPPFTLSLSGTTSTGKTSAMRIAGAIWGNTDERKPDSILQTWNQTQNAIIEKASSLDGIPLMMDDTQVAPSDHVIQNTIYSLSTGRSKGRLNRMGRAVGEKSSRTILISTGEMPMLEASQQGGTRARVLESWGDPWGSYDAGTGQKIRAVMRLSEDSYGNTGRQWIEHILAHRDDWMQWRTEHKTHARELENWLAEDRPQHHAALLGRLAEYISVIEYAMLIAAEAGLVPDTRGSDGYLPAITHLRKGAIDEAVAKDVPTEALRVVLEVATSRRADFFDSVNYSRRAPNTGWIGRWDKDGSLIYIVPSKLRRILNDEGFKPAAVLRAWKAREYLHGHENTRGNAIVAKMGETRCKMVAIKVDALAVALGVNPNDQDDLPFGEDE